LRPAIRLLPSASKATLAHIANQVFVELARELENQGLNRKVAADAFGVSLRTDRRKMQRFKERSTDSGRSLWEAVISYLEQEPIVTRRQILDRFHRDDEVSVRGILCDLVESGFVFCSGMEKDAVFRIATKEELETVQPKLLPRVLSSGRIYS
jgi:hypothetical protein